MRFLTTLSLFATLPACCCAAGEDKKRKVVPSSSQGEKQIKHRRGSSDHLFVLQPKSPSRLQSAPATSSGSRSAPAAGWPSSGAASAGGNPAASAGCASSCSAPAVGSCASGSSSAPKARGSGSSSAPKARMARGSVGVQLARDSAAAGGTHPNQASTVHRSLTPLADRSLTPLVASPPPQQQPAASLPQVVAPARPKDKPVSHPPVQASAPKKKAAECTHAECPYGPVTETLLHEYVKIISRLQVIEKHLGL